MSEVRRSPSTSEDENVAQAAAALERARKDRRRRKEAEAAEKRRVEEEERQRREAEEAKQREADEARRREVEKKERVAEAHRVLALARAQAAERRRKAVADAAESGARDARQPSPGPSRPKSKNTGGAERDIGFVDPNRRCERCLTRQVLCVWHMNSRAKACLICQHSKKECVVAGEDFLSKKRKLAEELGSGKGKKRRLESEFGGSDGFGERAVDVFDRLADAVVGLSDQMAEVGREVYDLRQTIGNGLRALEEKLGDLVSQRSKETEGARKSEESGKSEESEESGGSESGRVMTEEVLAELEELRAELAGVLREQEEKEAREAEKAEGNKGAEETL